MSDVNLVSPESYPDTEPAPAATVDVPPAASAGQSWLWVGTALAGAAVLALIAYVAARSTTGLHAGGRSVGVPEEAEPAISINSVLPHKKTLSRTFEQPASIRAWAMAELYAKIPGYLKRIAREAVAGKDMVLAPEKDIGSAVRAGEVLLEIEAPELHQDVVQKESMWKQTQAELERARVEVATFEAAVELEGKKLARLLDLAKSKTVTEELVDEKRAELAVASSKLAAAKADILVRESRVRVSKDEWDRARILAGYTQIRAPFDGVITYRGVDEGDFVQNASTGQTRPLMSVAATDKVKLVLQVPEREATWVEIGAEATVQVDARLNWKGKGRVARIGPTLDTQTRTRQVEIDLDNKDSKLMPGMYGQVTLVLQKIENAQAIPATAVYSRRGENFIIQVTDGVAKRQRVRIRFDDGKEVEVVRLVDGKELPLDGSEELIVSNKGEIADGQRVKATRLAGK